MKLTTTKTLLALSISALSSALYAAPYEIVDLGGLGGDSSVARDINQAGQVVGYANAPVNDDGTSDFVRHAVQFDDAGNIDYGTVENGTISEAFSINDSMVSVGLSNEVVEDQTENGTTFLRLKQHAVIFEGGVVTPLPELENLNNATAFEINNNGLIVLVGDYDVDPDDEINPAKRAFVFNRQDNSYSIVEPFGVGADKDSYLVSINDNNNVIGFSQIDSDSEQAIFRSFIAPADDLTQLTELPEVNDRVLLAQEVNNLDQIVGNAQIPNTRNQREAFFIDMAAGDTEPTFLGFIDSRYNDSRASDINNNGQIVGRALVSSPTIGEFGAFIYENGEMKNLNKLVACDTGWKLTEATAINDSGQITGFGAINGEVRAFRLDPTGEPVEDCSPEDSGSGGGSLPAFLVAMLAVLGIRRKYSKA